MKVVYTGKKIIFFYPPNNKFLIPTLRTPRRKKKSGSCHWLHHMKNQRLGNTRYMALKLNVSSAYEKVEGVMYKMGFNEK